MRIDGNDLYIADNTGDEVFVVPADTAHDATATITRRFDLPSGLTFPYGMTIDGNDLYITDNTGDEVFVVPANTAHDATATITRRFDLPSGLTVPHAMTIDGNDLYIADNTGDEVFVVPANTAHDATATITRRFDLPSGLTYPAGMTFASEQATATISTDESDIRAGETFDVDIDFDSSVTNFVASDITVTGGTRGSLSGSGDSYTLSVTAGTAGTLNISIAEDVVSPGNAASIMKTSPSLLNPTVTINCVFRYKSCPWRYYGAATTFTWSMESIGIRVCRTADVSYIMQVTNP